jgi:hypothetical protein
MVAFIHFIIIELEEFGRAAPHFPVPAVCEQYLSDIDKESRDAEFTF